MSHNALGDSIAIDTNVFVQLVQDKNRDKHITRLLTHLQQANVKLTVDDQNEIFGEYAREIPPRIRNASDKLNERQLLIYWFSIVGKNEIPLSLDDALMRVVKRLITESGTKTDQIFVYVALKAGSILISNDEPNIVLGTKRERRTTHRRDNLMKQTRKLRPKGSNILNSREASQQI